MMNEKLDRIYRDLKIEAGHLQNCKLSICEEPSLDQLELADIDFDGRPFILHKRAAKAWREMQLAAKQAGIFIEPYSGFRSYLHQKNIVKRKLERGKSLDAIFTETAIPGFSEHHTGRAVDICERGHFELEESFEKTTAFDWLSNHAALFGFQLSYPRNNTLGIIYEPWHWCFRD
jgi:zinc D-Ala-D-Ala carboxypeptidase